MNTEGQTALQTNEALPAIVSVAIVEDERKFRDAVTMLIEGTEGFRCSGSYRSMEEALDKIERDLPDVVLMDIGLPGMSGIEGARRLKERFPKMVLLAHTVYDDDERIFDALCAGASGYLLKKTPPARLLEGLQEAVKGGAPMTPEVARRVVKLLMEGHNYKTAAAKLGVTTHAISFHLQKIYEKLHVHSKTEAVAKALQDRLLK